MSKWTYKGKVVESPPEGTFGFIYKITFRDKYYIGCKQFYGNRTVKLSKKRSNELYKGTGRKPTKEKKLKESDWKKYNSSSWSKELKRFTTDEIDSSEVKWEMLEFGVSKSDLAYKETKQIICSDALLDVNCLNSWVTCKIHKTNL